MNRMDDSEPLEFKLLDLHLKRLDRGGAEAVEDAVAHSPELAVESQALRDLLNLLERYEVAEPPDDLADKVMARVGDRPGVIPFPQLAAETATASSSARDFSASAMLSLRELIAIAACITLFIGVFVPGYYRARSSAMRSLCRNNMAQIYGATASYAEANLGCLPSVGYVPNGYWQPVRVPHVLRASNTRHFFLLLREGNLKDPRAFLCPADTDARPMLVDDTVDSEDSAERPKTPYGHFSDFAERANNSYSFLFMNVQGPVRLAEFQKEGTVQMALAGDRNPLFDGRTVHRLNPWEDETFNSPTHENGAGQNVIYVDGHASWSTSPLVGVERDNIYRSGQTVRYLGNERPTSPTDSFLP